MELVERLDTTSFNPSQRVTKNGKKSDFYSGGTRFAFPGDGWITAPKQATIFVNPDISILLHTPSSSSLDTELF
jgi:hypothetical protein